MADHFVYSVPAPEGGRYNALLVADGWGQMQIKVESFSHGIDIFSQEDRTRYTKTEYPNKVTLSDFSVTVVHRNHRVAAAFAKRLNDYARLASDPDANVGAMVVIIPSRDFVRFGIPTRGVTFGDKAGAITYKMTLQFTAAEDPLSILKEEDLSRVSDITETNSMFYPADVGKAAEYALYRSPTSTPTIVKRGPS